MLPMTDDPLSSQSNLWLADTLWRLGAVQFGDFTLGRTTVHSPIYVNLRLLIAHPTALARAARILLAGDADAAVDAQPTDRPFDLVCGVPFGGLIVGEAFSLASKTPLIYLHPRKDDLDTDVEGIYHPSQTALIMDDLITGGGSIIVTANRLRDEGLFVRDAVVLFDRQSGGRKKLEKRHPPRLGADLRGAAHLPAMNGKIGDDWYRKSMSFFEGARATGRRRKERSFVNCATTRGGGGSACGPGAGRSSS